jgi:NADH:ubiquinone oxidoreductase subunit 3 (subunit A)
MFPLSVVILLSIPMNALLVLLASWATKKKSSQLYFFVVILGVFKSLSGGLLYSWKGPENLWFF